MSLGRPYTCQNAFCGNTRLCVHPALETQKAKRITPAVLNDYLAVQRTGLVLNFTNDCSNLGRNAEYSDIIDQSMWCS